MEDIDLSTAKSKKKKIDVTASPESFRHTASKTSRGEVSIAVTRGVRKLGSLKNLARLAYNPQFCHWCRNVQMATFLLQDLSPFRGLCNHMYDSSYQNLGYVELLDSCQINDSHRRRRNVISSGKSYKGTS